MKLKYISNLGLPYSNCSFRKYFCKFVRRVTRYFCLVPLVRQPFAKSIAQSIEPSSQSEEYIVFGSLCWTDCVKHSNRTISFALEFICTIHLNCMPYCMQFASLHARNLCSYCIVRINIVHIAQYDDFHLWGSWVLSKMCLFVCVYVWCGMAEVNVTRARAQN